MQPTNKLADQRTGLPDGQLVIFEHVYDNQSTTMQAKRQFERQPEEQPSAYKPLPSIWDGEDSELLERLLSFYPRKEPKRILDATVNGGRFWKGSTREVIGMDIAPGHRPALIGDNTVMPFADSVFDVIV